MESTDVERHEEGSNSLLFELLMDHDSRMVIALIGLISFFLPWVVWSSLNGDSSSSFIDIMLDPDTSAYLAISMVLFVVGTFVCALENESRVLIGTPILWVGMIGFFISYPFTDYENGRWGLGVYIGIFVALLTLYIFVKELSKELSTP